MMQPMVQPMVQPMDALVGLMPRLGVDAAACVALSLKRTRYEAALRLQCAQRRHLAMNRFAWLAMMEFARLLEANRHAGPAVSKAMPEIRPLPVVRQMVLLRVIVVGA